MKIISRLSILLLILFTLPLTAAAENGQQKIFNEAGNAYSNGNYAKACSLYEQFINQYGYSASALYNLGNCYTQSGDAGKAILNYERALRLAPGNSDIISNLQVIKTRQGLFDPELSTPEKLINLLTMNQWFMVGLGALAILTYLAIQRSRKNVFPKALVFITIICLTVLMASIICTLDHYRSWKGYVVITPESRLIISPFAGAASVGDIQPGRTVYILESHEDYFYVRDNIGRKGWLKKDTIEPIIPETAS